MRWKRQFILNRYLSDCPYIRLVLFNEKDIYIVLNEHNIDIFIDIFLAFTEPVWFNMVSVLKKYQKAVM